MKAFFQRNWIHFAAVAVMFIIVAIYFSPQFDGYGLKQHDVAQWKGMSHETQAFRDKGEGEPLWTNSMFGGMPTVQITMRYPGNWIGMLVTAYTELIPGPMGIVFLHLIGFYVLGLFLRIRPLVALIGAIAFSFASYEIIILQAGHVTKAMATAFMPFALGAFIYSYRNKSWLGVLLFAFFMACQLTVNHVQVTYYFAILLLFVGIYFFVKSITDKQLKSFVFTTLGLVGATLIAVVINNANLRLSNDYAKYTIRGKNDITILPNGLPDANQSAGLEKDYITNWSYGIGETFTLISPNVKGGGSFTLGGSQFEPILEQSDLSSSVQNNLKNYPAYWGDQPFTSGPVYVGVVVAFLAFLGLIFLKTRLKWALFAATVLAIVLSWGKNYMGFTEFFIDNVPFYNKFRTVTIILVLVELTVPLLGVLFLDLLIREKEKIKEKKKLVIIAVSTFIAFLFLIKIIGLGDGYTSQSDREQLANIERNISQQILSMDPDELKTSYGLDVNNSGQVAQFVGQQMKQYEDSFEDLKVVRKDIFDASMNRSLAFTFFTGVLIIIFVFYSLSPAILLGGILLLTVLDVIPVANQYLGKQEQGNGLKYWEDIGLTKYPVATNNADEQILNSEIAQNSKLAGIVLKAEKEGAAKADKLGYTGSAKNNIVDAEKFMALNFETNYRVFDLSGGFNSSRTSYFHKSLGGYHGAKLRNINNLMSFHLSKMNNKVYDMMNVKYFIQNTEQGQVAQPNPTAMGNAWLVKRVEEYATPDQEILALGSQFKLENKGIGRFLVNDKEVKEAIVYGGEKLGYLLPNSNDTLTVPLTNGMSEGMQAMWVMDAHGTTNLIPMITLEADPENSFLKLVQITVVNEFKPSEEVVMLKSEAAKLSAKSFSGEGTVKMTSYAPNKIVYTADLKGKQLVVFSEIYYPDGWKVVVNGKELPILKVNYLLRGVEIPGGNNKIEMVYDLPKYHSANTLAMIASILLIVGIGIVSYLERKKKVNQERF